MTETATRDTYHHGNLRAALVDAGLELTRRGGPAALSLRDVTRRAGVSPSAAYRHFADREQLLHAIAQRIQDDMAARMQASSADSAGLTGRERLRAVGLGYIAFARRETGWFETAFFTSRALPGESGMPAPLIALVDALDAMVREGDLPASARPGAEWPCWSAVHGFALLVLHGPAGRLSESEIQDVAARVVDTAIRGLADRAP
ncbi:TetR family transcriptional regulator [Microbacterium mangrovi]|uniref:TetR family transcriptional regulator n=1 Tax=Microbacterium mangrovi TaxID=1348253 RepID=A0A0B1ZXW7_9MICO|nr:TetR/AcrR family transcriptional regulator [Microbacterium mangrovi]KHK96070.1 TetR family transcriptional regulator [Microbacterium mangrovi]